MTLTRMRREVLEIPEAVERLLTRGAAPIAAAAMNLKALDPRFLTTVARGSSDHAATYLQYACALTAGIPVASLAPSIASVYKAPLRLDHSACIAVSQSGKSPDIVAMTRAAEAGGAITVALTNDTASPLALAAHHPVDICAGPELSVAATKTFVTSVVAGLLLLAKWREDPALEAALHQLPEKLARAAGFDWPAFRAALAGRQSLYVLARGPGLAIANEAALKFKETCQVHAESYSSAEVLHGPVSIVDPGFPVLALASRDAAGPALAEVADALTEKGASVFATTGDCEGATVLDHVATGHPLTDPLALVVSFYAMVEQLAADRGINPDAPRHLKKVTETR